jgi:hypothetical protein
VQADRKSAIGVSALRRVYRLILPKQVAHCILNAMYGVMYLSQRGGADFLSALH